MRPSRRRPISGAASTTKRLWPCSSMRKSPAITASPSTTCATARLSSTNHCGKSLDDRALDRVRAGALDADQARGHHPARRRRQPVAGEERRHLARERRLGHAVEEQRVGDELGVHLPLQEAAPERARVVVGARRRMRRAVAVEQRREMRPVALAVAPGGVALGLDRQVQRPARRGQLRERPGVQLVRQRIAVGIVVEGERHGGLLGTFRRRLHAPAGSAHPPASCCGAA